MKSARLNHRTAIWLAFTLFFGISLALGAILGCTQPANAAQAPTPQTQTSGNYAGPDACAGCHKELFETWKTTRHANAFSSPIFQRDWAEIGSDFTCLECHTTGYDIANSAYAHEGVTCESCHGPFQPGHPESRCRSGQTRSCAAPATKPQLMSGAPAPTMQRIFNARHAIIPTRKRRGRPRLLNYAPTATKTWGLIHP